MLIPHMSLMRGGTQCMPLSAANVQVSAWDAHAGPSSIVLVQLGRASVTPMARMPCCIVPGEPARRARGEPDGGQVGHDLLARLRAEEPSGGSLRARGTCVFVS